MKKLLVAAMVLSVATVASAALQISINSDQQANEATITMVPSGIVTLDIWTTTGISDELGGQGYYAMLATMTGGTISGGAITNADWWGCLIYDDAASNITIPEGDNGVYGVIATATTTQEIPALATIFDGIIFHCEGQGDVTVTLYSLDGDTGELLGTLDSVVIHQIVPEPMTLGLLGLGGLFLRRRSK